MNVLFDASAMFKRYSGEVGVSRVLQLQAQATAVTAAVHCKTEVASARAALRAMLGNIAREMGATRKITALPSVRAAA